MPAWARTTIYTLGGIAAFCILLSSCWSLASLAVQAGLGWPQLLLLPVAMGLGAIVAGVLWVAGQGQMRDTGKWATIALVFAFAVFNAADNLARHDVLTGGQLMVISVVIAVVFPVTAGLLGHIARLARSVPTRYSFAASSAASAASKKDKDGILTRVKQRVARKRDDADKRPTVPVPTSVGTSAGTSSSTSTSVGSSLFGDSQSRSTSSSWWPRQDRTEDVSLDRDRNGDQTTLPYQATPDQREN
ncbi:hypothetical protein [Pseudonocardia acaciae]|uniref:hypothetical protein n=1 Tax=Pseudonocardia acaciae TaxID=551276 RepID=UPI00049106F4|nr:hypothetical protein [Pseudonocardia acaciae]